LVSVVMAAQQHLNFTLLLLGQFDAGPALPAISNHQPEPN
jgi:hypothetical protein